MPRVFTPTSWCWLLTISLASAVAGATQPTADDSPEKKPSSTLHGRLPAYYRQVVREEQRMEIYRIQTEYNDKLDALQNQWKMLKEERDAKIEAVLTEAQKKQVEKAAAEAKVRRAAKTKKKPLLPAESTPASTPANQ